jgi:hypothetical protein
VTISFLRRTLLHGVSQLLIQLVIDYGALDDIKLPIPVSYFLHSDRTSHIFILSNIGESCTADPMASMFLTTLVTVKCIPLDSFFPNLCTVMVHVRL